MNADTITYVDGELDPFTGVMYQGAQDTMIITNAGDQQDQNYGAYQIMSVGSALSFGPRRSLIRFDVSSLAGKYSKINSVTLRLTLTSAEGAGTVQVFPLAVENKDWVEGDGNVDQQNDDDSGQTTWDAQIHSLIPWAGSPGAGIPTVDYYVGAMGEPLASMPFQVAPAIIDFVFSDINIVDGWMTTGVNAGLLLKTQFEIEGNRAHFLSSEYFDSQFRPQLIIDYDPLIQVEVDINPGSDSNSINLGGRGVIPVAVLSTNDFDALTIDPSTVMLAGASVAVVGVADKASVAIEDVNGDGWNDLKLKIDTENLDSGEVQSGFAVLVGETYTGEAIEGIVSITIVPPQ